MDAQSFGITFGSFVAGVLCGLAPLIVGINKRRPVLAVLGFLACTGCGLVLGLILAGPVGLLSAAGIANLQDRRRYRRY